MSLTAKNIISLLSLEGVGRTSVLCFAKYAERSGFEIHKIEDYRELISICHKTEKSRINAENYSISDFERVDGIANGIIDKSHDKGIKIVSYSDDSFPSKLKHIVSKKISAKGKETIKDESSVILYYRGDDISRLNDIMSVAIIGTREPTQEGKTAGLYMAKEFSKQGFNIVGGLALGCDTYAHEGAVEAGGITTAFVAHGLHTIFPKENEELAKEIVSKGGFLISEYPIGVEPYAPYFVERDRLQSGLADATIVIQTGIAGGTMHAVIATLDNDKPLFAVVFTSDDVMYHEKVLGNIYLIKEKKAIPINSSNLGECISLIKNKQSDKAIYGEQLSLW